MTDHPLYNPAKPETSWALNPWAPMTKLIDLKHLNKFAEELGEATSAVARCLMQGIDEQHPVTNKPNKEWLEDEIADVVANAQLCIQHFQLDEARIHKRVFQKMEHLRAWHQMLEGEK